VKNDKEIYKKGESHQFGKPNGNKQHPGGLNGGGKTNRQWVCELMQMNEAEIKAFAEDITKPAIVRKFAIALVAVADVRDVSIAIDIVESKPVTLIDQKTTLNKLTKEEFLEEIKKTEEKV